MVCGIVESVIGISFGGSWYWFKRGRYTFGGNVRRGYRDNIYFIVFTKIL